MKYSSSTSSGFSIIEVLIGIFVFSLWLVAVFALLTSALSVNDTNKNSIIASNLAREQIELYRNIRDNNYKKLKLWNLKNPDGVDYSTWSLFQPGEYYTLENNYNNWVIQVESISDPQSAGAGVVFSDTNIGYGRLCLDSDKRYMYCTGWWEKQKFARYIYITELSSWSYQVTSKVIWYKRWYHEYDIQTIVTDWRRI